MAGGDAPVDGHATVCPGTAVTTGVDAAVGHDVGGPPLRGTRRAISVAQVRPAADRTAPSPRPPRRRRTSCPTQNARSTSAGAPTRASTRSTARQSPVEGPDEGSLEALRTRPRYRLGCRSARVPVSLDAVMRSRLLRRVLVSSLALILLGAALLHRRRPGACAALRGRTSCKLACSVPHEWLLRTWRGWRPGPRGRTQLDPAGAQLRGRGSAARRPVGLPAGRARCSGTAPATSRRSRRSRGR